MKDVKKPPPKVDHDASLGEGDSSY
jgi:hypothetical protein